MFKSKNLIFSFLILIGIICCKQNDSEKIIVNESNESIDLLFKQANFEGLKTRDKLIFHIKIFNILSQRDNDSINRYYYFKLASRFYNLNDVKSFGLTSKILYDLSRKSRDTLSEVKSLRNLGEFYYINYKNDSAYYYFSKSEKINQKLKTKADLSGIQLYKSNILLFEKDFAGCEVATIIILKAAIKKNDYRLIYDCYITLGNALDGLNDFDKSLEYYNKAFEITKKLKNDSQFLSLKSQTYYYIGSLFNKNKNYKQAIFYFEKGIEFSASKKLEPYLYANFINNLAYSKFKLGDKSAINQLNEAYQILDSLKNIPGIVSSKINLSEYYLVQKDSSRALTFSSEARKLAHDNKIFEDELKTLELLAKIDPKQVKFYNNRFIKLTDSLQNNERATRNKFARIEFETDEILNQKKEIETEKNEISSQRWLILGSSLLALMIGGLLYFSKMQHSRNKVLEFEKEQQIANEAIYQLMLDQQTKIDEGRNVEKKRISQELHDGIMSKLTSTRLNLFILSKKTDEETIKKCLVHIDNIQDIEKEIRAISHDLAKDIFVTKDSFKIIIEELFQDQALISKLDYTLYIDQNINWENIASTTKMHLYRIFQESLQNIYKYADAKNISTKILKLEDLIEIEIIDDGKGFDVLKTKDGIGLKNMKSRSDLINGVLNIESNPDDGTKLSLVFPI